MFRMVTSSKKKVVLIVTVLILVIAVGSVAALSFLGSDNKAQDQKGSDKKQEVSTQDKAAGSANSATPAKVFEPQAPPEANTPGICATIQTAVKTAAGADLKVSSGREAKTKDSQFKGCDYAKDAQKVNVLIYEYSSADAAAKGLSELQVSGYATKQKGKRVVSVLSMSGNAPNMSTASSVLDAVLGKL